MLKNHASARTARHEREDESGHFRRAPVDTRQHLQRPVPSVDDRGTLLDGLEFRAPDERRIAEHPQRRAAAPLAPHLRQHRQRVAHRLHRLDLIAWPRAITAMA